MTRSLVPRRVVIFTYDGAQSLDVSGPAEVFSAATRLGNGAGYSLELAGPTAAPIRTTSGLRIAVDAAITDVRGPVDTLVVAGGEGVRELMLDAASISAIRRIAAESRRVTSVCSGAFALAQAGLLDGRRATTHWSSCDLLARMFPAVTVEPDPIFVRDGNVATSAGVTAGIDLCLALVEEDHGRDLALAVARQLVVFLKRPGGQSQFSAHLQVQLADRDVVAEVQTWVADHLDEDLAVERLASRAAMSPRHFARIFRAETGSTPARFVERARVEAARRRLEESSDGVDAVARACGFGTSETLRRSFLRAMRVAPTEYRQRFRAAAPAPQEVAS